MTDIEAVPVLAEMAPLSPAEKELFRIICYTFVAGVISGLMLAPILIGIYQGFVGGVQWLVRAVKERRERGAVYDI